MLQVPATNLLDGYKTDHRRQYPTGTERVNSNLTPRGSRIKDIDNVVVFAIQYFIKKHLIERWDKTFFHLPKEEAVRKAKRRFDFYTGPNSVPVDHLEALHDLGYLPLHIKALPEGSLCPMRIPLATIDSTHKDFFWLTNSIETIMSNEVWGPITSATIAFQYRKMLNKFKNETSELDWFVDWQAHDFSFRGMYGEDAAMMSGAAHLLSFTGTDTIPAIDWLEHYYGANAEKELIGGSVYATEHSVMCMGGKETEIETFRRLITKLYPTGIVSIVSDTWDYWKVLTEIALELKPEIMAREGVSKVVFRPDSGDPVKIICGDSNAPVGTPEYKGSIEVLWEIFGGTVNSKGYKQLDPHVGLIYGDSITLPRCEAICEGLKAKGFASTNVVFGVGSYTYQYNTRDTFGFAIKATYGEVNGEKCELWKDPKTDDGLKKSAKGLLRVNEDYSLTQSCTEEEFQGGLLETVFLNGKLVKEQTLSEIRQRLAKNV